jgi:glycosyltransferase involved in cell wall biosynthesis
MFASVAAVGDVSQAHCWSGVPFHFWQAAMEHGIDAEPWRVDLARLRWPRLFWNICQGMTGSVGGFQYSTRCLRLLEEQVPDVLWRHAIVSFNQHFPRASRVVSRGGEINHYLDAPFSALASGRGLSLQLPRRVLRNAIALERENYAASKRVVAMGRWAADAIVSECDVPSSKVHVILPGANLVLPENWEFPEIEGRAGVDRPFTLGFVGKDWQRKGLPLLVEIREELTRRGWNARVLAAGQAPPELKRCEGVEFVGFIDKAANADGFTKFLTACDVGCLFSDREALGISTLEFLRAGVPVAGFAHEGPADTLPPDAGFRIPFTTPMIEIADRFEAYLEDEAEQHRFGFKARQWSGFVTWGRCIQEFQELWKTGTIAKPIQPWKGLEGLVPPERAQPL